MAYQSLIKSIHITVMRDKRIKLSSLGLTNLIFTQGHHSKGSSGPRCSFSSDLRILNPFSGASQSTSHISDNEASQHLLKVWQGTGIRPTHAHIHVHTHRGTTGRQGQCFKAGCLIYSSLKFWPRWLGENHTGNQCQISPSLLSWMHGNTLESQKDVASQ